MILGLTGLYCAGKNFIASLLEDRGFSVLDLDKLGWKALNEAKDKIEERWGGGALLSSGLVDRRSLGKLVFRSKSELAELEGIVHPIVDVHTRRWIEENRGKKLVINAALLHKSSIFVNLDFIIVVRASLLSRIMRAKKRDKLGIAEILRRFGAQKSFYSQYFNKSADTIMIDNEGFGVFSRFFRKGLLKKLDSLMLLK